MVHGSQVARPRRHLDVICIHEEPQQDEWTTMLPKIQFFDLLEFELHNLTQHSFLTFVTLMPCHTPVQNLQTSMLANQPQV